MRSQRGGALSGEFAGSGRDAMGSTQGAKGDAEGMLIRRLVDTRSCATEVSCER